MVEITFGEWLKQRRRQLDLTQQELSKRIGYSINTVRKIERDERRPSKQLAKLLATELGIPTDKQAAFITFARTEAYTADMSETLAVLAEVEPEPVPLFGEMPTPPPSKPTNIRHNLPLQQTPFLGREQEINMLLRYLGDPNKRLITIIGAGGMGKTRLALAVAEQCLRLQPRRDAPPGRLYNPQFTNGVYFVPLAPLSDPDQIIPTLADVLDFPLETGGEQRRTAKQQVLDYLRQKVMLLVLDNFEHLLAPPKSPRTRGTGGGELVADILQSAPQVKIIATSRERLQLHQEQLFTLQGLDTPASEQEENVEYFTAVQLFLQSARRVKHDFQLREGDQRWLTRICHLVAGMPLAVELAAGWVEMLSLADIAQEIQQSLDFLEADLHNMPSRHRSMQAVFASSWQRLDKAEREVLSKLSVFRGGFTRQAAQAVAGATLRQLLRLVSQSLVQAGGTDGRYQLHELLRQYGAEKLKESGEDKPALSGSAGVSQAEVVVRDQHSRYFCRTLNEKEQALKSPQRRIAMAEIEVDLGNMEDAWRWAVQRRLWAALHLADHTLFWFYSWHFRFQDNLALCQFTVDHLGSNNLARLVDLDTARVLLKALLWQAESYINLFHFPPVKALWLKCETLLQSQALAQIDTRRDEAFLYHMKAEVAFGNRQEALAFAQQSLSLARASEDQWLKAKALDMLGKIFSRQHYEMAQKNFNEGLAIVRLFKDSLITTNFLIELGLLAGNMLEFEQSEAFFNEGLVLAQSQNDNLWRAKALAQLGYLQAFLGKFGSGANYLSQAVKLFKDNGNLYDAAITMHPLAQVYTWSGHLSQAKQYIEESLQVAEAFPGILEFVLMTRARIDIWTGEYEAAKININRHFSNIDETSEGTEHVFEGLYGPPGWLALAHSELATAKEYLQKIFDYYHPSKARTDREWSAIYLATLSRAEWGLGQYASARQQLLQALAVTVKIRAFITLLHVLPIVPIFLAAEGDVGYKTRAIEIYALAHSHPFIANCQFFYDIAGKDMKTVEADLPPDIIAAAKTKGQSLDFWQTAESLLEELTELGWDKAAD